MACLDVRALVFGLLLVPGLVSSQEPGAKQASRERELLRRAQAAQQQAEAVRTAAEDARVKLEAELKALQGREREAAAEGVRTRQRADGVRASLDAMTRERDALQKEKAALAERLAQTEGRLGGTSAELVEVSKARTELDGTLARERAARAELEDMHANCRLRNTQLRQVADELMSKYRTVGVWDALRRAEPFTGLRKAQVDNLLEEYRDRAADATLPSAR